MGNSTNEHKKQKALNNEEMRIEQEQLEREHESLYDDSDELDCCDRFNDDSRYGRGDHYDSQ